MQVSFVCSQVHWHGSYGKEPVWGLEPASDHTRAVISYAEQVTSKDRPKSAPIRKPLYMGDLSNVMRPVAVCNTNLRGAPQSVSPMRQSLSSLSRLGTLDSSSVASQQRPRKWVRDTVRDAGCSSFFEPRPRDAFVSLSTSVGLDVPSKPCVQMRSSSHVYFSSVSINGC